MARMVYSTSHALPTRAVLDALGEPGHRRQVDAFVCADSRAEAARLLGISVGNLLTYGYTTPIDQLPSCWKIAARNPGQAYARPLARTVDAVPVLAVGRSLELVP